MDPSMPILSPSQHGSPMGMSMGGMQSSNEQMAQNGRVGHHGVSLAPSSMVHALGGTSRGSISGSMLLRLPDTQMQDAHAELSQMQLRQMHMMMDSADRTGLGGPGSGLHHSDKPSITNNSDLLKAFTTMSSEQQKSLLSNINSKLMTSHVGDGVQMPDSRQHSGHMNGYAPNRSMAFPDHDPMLPVDVPPPPLPPVHINSSSPGLISRGAFTSAGELALPRYGKDLSFGSLLGQSAPGCRSARADLGQKLSSAIMVDIDVQGNDSSVQNPGSAASTSTQERVKPMFSGRMSTGSEPLLDEPPPSPPQKKQRASSDELPKNPNRNMSGVPEWSQEEVDAVMRLYDERGRLPKWKPIADELARMNARGALNHALHQKGLTRSNNAVMNKVKEILYKELGDAPIRGDNGGDGVPKRSTAGVPEWNEAEINAVLELWNKHGRQSEWKSISLELSALNSTGELNAELAAKGLQRTNNAVMNKVKELSGIARARRSRPRTIGNFALLPMEHGKTSPSLARQRSGAEMLPTSELLRLGQCARDLCDGQDLDASALDGCFALAGIKPMSVVSPVRTTDAPPVLIQAVEHCPVPAVPHVPPVQCGMMHSSPVIQQEPTS